MRILIQRVKEASVVVDGKIISRISEGILALLGICETDTEYIADAMLEKMVKLRVFADENGKTNLSVSDVGGNLLIISQFTLYADCRKGNRPSFTSAANPKHAQAIYEYFLKRARERFKDLGCGEFGADMRVSLINDGPFTVMLDSAEIVKK